MLWTLRRCSTRPLNFTPARKPPGRCPRRSRPGGPWTSCSNLRAGAYMLPDQGDPRKGHAGGATTTRAQDFTPTFPGGWPGKSGSHRSATRISLSCLVSPRPPNTADSATSRGSADLAPTHLATKTAGQAMGATDALPRQPSQGPSDSTTPVSSF